MFDFILKRSASKPNSTSGNTPEKQPEDACNSQILARQAVMTQAASFKGQEAEAVEFILHCDFADARLKAAEHLQSETMLERVLHAMRNVDRRVAKLMQTRLDNLQQHEIKRQQAQQCVDDALRLAQEPHLIANQVADLDHAWQAISGAPDDCVRAFESARSILRDRLQEQAALQRAIIDALNQLRNVGKTVRETTREATPEVTQEAGHARTASDLSNVLDVLEREMSQHRMSREVSSLPKHLIPEFEQQHHSLKQMLASLADREVTISARKDALDRWEAKTLLKEELLQREWHALPALEEGETQSALQARFDALILGARASRAQKKAATQEVAHDVIQQFSDVLNDLEKALQDGALQLASEHDKALRAIDLKVARLSTAQSDQLANARSELSRLQGWAKWGGNISREELLKAAEGLPSHSLAVLELAKKVGSLRERWKSLDVSAGPASKELWQSFDAACTAAYAPAAAHFKKLSEERQQNMAKAQAMIEQVGKFVATSHCASADATDVDWKNVASFLLREKQAWQRLGTIERKEKRRLDAEFDRAMQAASAPLQQRREIEIKQREKLIAQVSDLKPSDRTAPDALRDVQAAWQERAKSLPLDRHDEQALWQRFRTACDAVFAKRKEFAAAADSERQQQLSAREAICATLEATCNASEAVIAKVLRESKDAWDKTGPVPRAAEARIEARYKAAMATLKTQLDASKQAAAVAQRNALRDKMNLCQSLEKQIVDGSTQDDNQQDNWASKWQALPLLSNEFERTLRQRFDAAIVAMESNAGHYAQVLEKNRTAVAQALLRLEIIVGSDSPPELSRERLKLQVEVLQSSLKAGQKPITRDAQLLSLCGMPALLDEQTTRRIEQLLALVAS